MQKMLCNMSKSTPTPTTVTSQQAKNIGPTWAPNGFLYGSYTGNP